MGQQCDMDTRNHCLLFPTYSLCFYLRQEVMFFVRFVGWPVCLLDYGKTITNIANKIGSKIRTLDNASKSNGGKKYSHPYE